MTTINYKKTKANNYIETENWLTQNQNYSFNQNSIENYLNFLI